MSNTDTDTEPVVIDDSCFVDGLFSEVCDRCRWRDFGAHRKCAAFKDKIPLDIWQGRNDHTSPVKGDRGKQFEPKGLGF